MASPTSFGSEDFSTHVAPGSISQITDNSLVVCGLVGPDYLCACLHFGHFGDDLAAVAENIKTAVLALSLAANAALTGFIAVKNPNLIGLGSETAPKSMPMKQPVSTTPSQDWNRLSSGDAKTQVANLKAAGFPPEFVQGIIRAELDRVYNVRRKELLARYSKGSYWQASYTRANFSAVLGRNIIQEEENGQMRALFGPEADNTAYDTGHFMPPNFNLRGQSEALPPEKFQKVAAIVADYNAMRADLYASANGLVDPDAGAKNDYLSKQQKADIEAALSPDELLEYNLRSSPDANSLRWTLDSFKPTEGEFRSIYKVQDEFNRRYSTDAGLAPGDVQKERDAHKTELDAELQETLGPDRFAQYKVEIQPNYGPVSRVTEALNLPSGSAQQLIDVEGDITKRMNLLKSDSTLSDADRTTQLAALNGEARARLSSVLGEKGLELYKANAGYWLNSLPQSK